MVFIGLVKEAVGRVSPIEEPIMGGIEGIRDGHLVGMVVGSGIVIGIGSGVEFAILDDGLFPAGEIVGLGV